MKKVLKCLMFFFVLTVCLLCGKEQGVFATNVKTTKQRPIQDGVYQIASKMDQGYCLDIFAEASLDGTDVILWTLNTENDFMKFRFTYLGDGYYKITNIGSNKVIEAAKDDPESTVQQNTWEGNNRQKWKLYMDEDGYFEISPKSTPSCRIDVTSGKADDWQYIDINPSDESNAQKWAMIPVEKPGQADITSFKSKQSQHMTAQWKKMSNVDGYHIQIARNSTFTNGKQYAYTTSTTKTFSDLTGGKRYYARVRAYCKVGIKKYYGAWSDIPSAVVLKGKPISKASLKTVKSYSKKKLTISWGKLKYVDSYVVKICPNKQFSSNTLTRYYKSSISKVTLKNMSSKKTYYVKVAGRRKESGVYTYGSWSSVKKVKIK